jgi:hypothetical protein
MKRKPRQYSREKRKEQVLGQFAVWYSKGDTEPKTMQRIARALDLVPSTKFRDLLLEMEAQGLLTVQIREKSGRWTARAYYPVITPLITEKSFRRQITLRKRGVAVGQLELPTW